MEVLIDATGCASAGAGRAEQERRFAGMRGVGRVRTVERDPCLMAAALAGAEADFCLLLRGDTVIEPSAVAALMATLRHDPAAAIAEARLAPTPRLKYFDPFTRETSWCSREAAVVRIAAVRQAGGLDPRFCGAGDDVDLSWRLWQAGWKCLHVDEAVALGDLWRPTSTWIERRNGFWLRHLYGDRGERWRHGLAILRDSLFSMGPSLRERAANLRGLSAALRELRALRPLRRARALAGAHPQICFRGWRCGQSLPDVAEGDVLGASSRDVEPLAGTPEWRALLRDAEGGADRYDFDARAVLGGLDRPALIFAKRASLAWPEEIPPETTFECVAGRVASAAPGSFRVRNGAEILADVDLGPGEENRWHRLEIELPNGCEAGDLVVENRGEGWLYFGDPRLSRPKPAAPHLIARERPAITLVAPTHNRAASVPRIIGRLLDQDFDEVEYEVVVIDSASADDTPKVLAEMAARDPRVRPYRCEKKGAAAARNLGVDKARGDLVVLIDDDILVRKDFLSTLWREHRERPDRVLLANILAPWAESPDPFQRYLYAAEEVNAYGFPDPDDVPPEYFFTGCVAIPRSVLGNTRFDEGFTVYGVEDIDFGVELLRGGVRMRHLRELRVSHEYYPTFKPFCRKRKLSGYSLGYYLEKKPWKASRHVFQPWVRKWHRQLGVLVKLSRPAAWLAERWETINYGVGRPVSRFLSTWYKVAVRISL
ncbi:MAG TPA: glycosyltransferase, partial [Planctomycetia bacterium]|nr:glycosyltransferase [Planctomycetia bacterium]